MSQLFDMNKTEGLVLKYQSHKRNLRYSIRITNTKNLVNWFLELEKAQSRCLKLEYFSAAFLVMSYLVDIPRFHDYVQDLL